MNVGNPALNPPGVQDEVDRLADLRYTVADIVERLRETAQERLDRLVTAGEVLASGPPDPPFDTIPEHLVDQGDVNFLNDIISIKQDRVEQDPNEDPAIMDFPYHHLDRNEVDTYEAAKAIYEGIPAPDRAPAYNATDLFPVAFSLTIPYIASQKDIMYLCFALENTSMLYSRYVAAYEWTFSQTKVAAAIAGDEFPNDLLDAECLALYRIGIKKRIGTLLLENQKFWVPNSWAAR